MAEELYTPVDSSSSDPGLYTPVGPSPDLMSALSHVESGSNPNAVGPSITKYAGTPDEHAIGEYQLLPSTAAQYGMDPHDPEQNRQAAQLHMTHLLSTFGGDEDKAIMAYNAGEGNIKKGVVPAETKDYLQKVRQAQQAKQELYTPVQPQQVSRNNGQAQELYTPVAAAPDRGGDSFAYDLGNTAKDAYDDTVNKATSIANGIFDNPTGFMNGINISLVGMAGMGVEALHQGLKATGKNLNPLPDFSSVTPASIMKEIGARSQQFSDAIYSPDDQKEAGVQAGADAVAAPWNVTGGYVAGQLEKAGLPQIAALINLAGIYSMFLGGSGKGKGKGKTIEEGKEPKLSPDQQKTFNEALKAAQDEAKAKTGAPMLEDQSALEAASKVAPDELGRVEPTLAEEPAAEGPKTAPEPLAEEKATETPPAPKDVLPEPPGTSPIPEGSVRLYHQTIEDNLPSIQKEGLIAGKGVGAATGDPTSVYASEKGFYGPPGSRPTVEFQVPKERVGANGTVSGSVLPENIIAMHLPWHDLARAIEKDPALIRKAVGGFLDLGKEDKPAIDYIKEKYSDEKYGPNKISPLGGVGKKQGGAINIWSVKDTPEQVADFEKAKAVLGRTDMPAEEFMAKNPVATEDVRSRIGLGTGSFRTNNELKSNINNPNHAIHTLAYLDDTMHLLKERLERKILESSYPHTSVFLKYFKDSNYADLKASAPIANWFERNAGEWFDGKNYSPTLKQLTDKGMSEGAALAWDHLYKGWEAVWPDLLDFAKSKGIDEPTRLPGYLPHFTQGAWRVRLYRDAALNQTGIPLGDKEYFATIGARSSTEAARLQEAAKRLIDPSNPDHAGLKTLVEQPQVHNDLAGMISGLFGVKDQVRKNQGISDLLNKLYEQASVGSLKQSLERQETPQILHQMDRIVSDGDFQLTRKQASDAVVKMTKIMEGIPAMKMRADFVTKYLFPLEQAGYFEGLPKMRTAAEEYMKQFLHIPDNASGHIDGFIKDLFATHGLAPEIPMQIIRSSVGWASKFYLFYSPKYWAQNIFQKVLFMGAVWTAKADLLTFGIKEGSVTKAIMDDLTSTSRGTMLSSGESLHSYVEKTGHANPTFVENMDTSKFAQDPFARGVERYTRQGGARLGYALFRQVFDEKEALAAAGRMTDAMNGVYDSEMGRGFLLAKEGQVGKPLGMFIQYPMQYFQFISSQIRTVVNASRISPEATAHAVTGLAYTTAMMVAAGGLGGLPLMQNYNYIIEQINKAFAVNWPSAKKWARDIGAFMHKQNFNDEFTNMVAKTAEFGVLGASTGYDISGSLQGPSVQAPEVFARFISSLGAATILSSRWLANQPVSRKEWGELLPDLPSVVGLRSSVEHYLRGDDVKSIIDKLKGVQSETAPDPHNVTLPGYYKRTPMDMFMNFLNIKSTGEAAANTTLKLNTQERAADTATAGRILDSLKENPKDPRRQEWLQELAQIALRGTADPLTLPTVIKQYQKDLNMTGQEREAIKAIQGNRGEKLKWERLQQMRALEPK